MIAVPKESFAISHFDSLLSAGTLRAGANLVRNPGFETGSAASWPTSTNWTVVASDSVTPNGRDNFVAQAASASKGQISTLESTRDPVTALGTYLVACGLVAPTGSPKRANNLQVSIKWWSSGAGGSPLREDFLWAAPVKARKGNLRSPQLALTSPVGATHFSMVIKNIYGSSTTGAGYGVLVDNAFLAGQIAISQLTPLEIWSYGGAPIRFSRLKFSWDERMGCKAMGFRLHGPSEYLWFLLHTALGHWIETQYEGERTFGGMLWSFKGNIGGRSMGVSLDSLFNYIAVPVGDNYYFAGDAASALQYGRKDLVAEQAFDSASDAEIYAEQLLEEMAFPLPVKGDEDGDAQDYLDIEVMGLAATLQWVKGVFPLWAGQVDTAAAIANLARTAYGRRSLFDRLREETPNDFISSDYALVENAGVTHKPVPKTGMPSAQEIYLRLIERGTSNRRRIVSGIGADRRFFMRERSGGVTYHRRRDRDGKMSYYDTAGNEVARALVRPGAFVSEGYAVPSFDITPGSDAARDPANRYLTTTEYDHESDDLRVEFLGKRRFEAELAKATVTASWRRR